MTDEIAREKYEEEYFNRHTHTIQSCRRGGYAGYEKVMNPEAWQHHLDRIFKYKNKGNALDIGCAYGLFLKSLPESFQKYGADISKHAVKKSKEVNPEGNFVVADIGKTRPFKGKKFDIVTLFDTIEHVTNVEQTLKNLQSLLKDDGYVFLMVPIASKFHHLISAFGFGLLNNDVSHISCTRRETWMGIFNDYFNVVEEFPLTSGKRYVRPLRLYHYFVLGNKRK